MLIVRDLTGKEEGVSDYTGIERKRTVNGEKTLSFSVRKTRRNEHSLILYNLRALLSMRMSYIVLRT
ncbi:hypothetical protein AAAC51_43455 [Priestia megaterium]